MPAAQKRDSRGIGSRDIYYKPVVVRYPSRVKYLATALAACALALGACSSAPQADVSDAPLVVELRDYSLKPNVPSVKAGKVKIGIRNLAGMAHDLTVIRTDLPEDKLPIDTASAKAKEDGKVGKLDLIGAGRVAALTVDLTPGTYVLVCNVAGHYQLGMHATLKVE